MKELKKKYDVMEETLINIRFRFTSNQSSIVRLTKIISPVGLSDLTQNVIHLLN